MQQLRQRAAPGVQLQEQQLRSAHLISQSLDLLTSSLAAQEGSVAFVSAAAAASLDNVRAGNRELREVVQRPSTLRNAAVALLLALWVVLLVCDYYN